MEFFSKGFKELNTLTEFIVQTVIAMWLTMSTIKKLMLNNVCF
jgi:hypothetical protein